MTYLRFVNITMLILVVALQFRLWSDEGGIPQIWDLTKSTAEQRAENEKLQALNNKLRATTQNLQNRTEELEGLARSRQGLIKEGESFFLIVYEKDPAPEKPEPRAKDTPIDNNFSFPPLSSTEEEKAKQLDAEVDEVEISPSS